MTLLGNPTRKRGIRCIFLAYASGYQVFKQHQFVLAALGMVRVIRNRRSKLLGAGCAGVSDSLKYWQVLNQNIF